MGEGRICRRRRARQRPRAREAPVCRGHLDYPVHRRLAAWGEVYSQIVFFEDKRTFGEFTPAQSNLAFSSDIAKNYKGMAVFTVANTG